MKMTPELFAALRDAIDASGGLTSDATMRNRWDALWRSGFDVNLLYHAGLLRVREQVQ